MAFDKPQSRNEAILQNMLGANNELEPPKSRVEALLQDIAGQMPEANPSEGTTTGTLERLKIGDDIYTVEGGGSGTSDYDALNNKPQIAGVTLSGDKSLADLGIASATTVSGILDGTDIDSFGDVETALGDKVDKVNGKGLSTNDYTDADKAIVGGVTAALAGKVDKVDGKGLSSNDFTDAYKSAIGDNTTAINGIKNGASINSFGGVETALADKADKSALKNEFIGTTAQWNALTTAQKKEYDTYQITDDYTEGSGGLPDYSTTEQLTGQKWIDGKDVYFIVIELQSAVTLNPNQWANLGVNIPISTGISAVAIAADGTCVPVCIAYDAQVGVQALNMRTAAIPFTKFVIYYTKIA